MNYFITGGTTGIGFELAKLFLHQGHRVGICGRDLSKLSSVFCEQYKQSLWTYQLDVGDRETLIRAVHDFSEKAQGLDVMIANAGRSVGSKTNVPDFKAAKEILETNVLGVLYSFEAAMQHFVNKKSGHLVAIASVAGFVGLPGAGAYSASKAAVVRLCESWSIDLKPLNIPVSCICPGFIDTPMTQKNSHAMPFLMSGEKGAELIAQAIASRRALYLFPLRMNLVITLLHLMPRFLYRWLMGLQTFNYSKQSN
ncbi:MAG: SDR family NAD(P)-dependent oxidoreductase [Bdellovibrio sp.]|nr:SDR family NAD(P)-dependent oxidoreductase [Bdellovibrio sp.]